MKMKSQPSSSYLKIEMISKGLKLKKGWRCCIIFWNSSFEIWPGLPNFSFSKYCYTEGQLRVSKYFLKAIIRLMVFNE